MKNVNVADLKNNLSAYLDLVEQGEEIVIRNRDRAVGRIIPVRPEEDEEQELVLTGKLKLPGKHLTKSFFEKFLDAKKPVVRGGTSVETLLEDRNED